MKIPNRNILFDDLFDNAICFLYAQSIVGSYYNYKNIIYIWICLKLKNYNILLKHNFDNTIQILINCKMNSNTQPKHNKHIYIYLTLNLLTNLQ